MKSLVLSDVKHSLSGNDNSQWCVQNTSQCGTKCNTILIHKIFIDLRNMLLLKHLVLLTDLHVHNPTNKYRSELSALSNRVCRLDKHSAALQAY